MSSAQPKPILIRTVFSTNLEFEFGLIRSAVDRYPIISMDTEFPGTVIRPGPGGRPLPPESNYGLLKANVDRMHMIQIGLTLSDGEGNLPDFGTKCVYIWEFNFRDFDAARDPQDPDSVAMLRNQGINFEMNRLMGADSVQFGELLMSSGLVCNDEVSWVTFHCAYDFGYLVKTLTQRDLPDRLEEFLKLVRIYFGPKVFDVKHLIRFCENLYGGLDRVCTALGVERIVGQSHQAGSDSLLTLHAFHKIRKVHFSDVARLEKYANVLHGLDVSSKS
ncbi:probable CCR4-associated factor 1 homolog 11 [Syzygium oleosum]|uniref:probable CCR4-associated factor 1 homolog 11 n=1 Tax=Syzygium oleosum TaxID=219896 RepID=UPI0011D218BA|nr:probable CCR4-associated factor 1 homolog 11 [Syzygium oleosum]